MLSFDTVHTITEHLLAATTTTPDEGLDAYNLYQPPTLLLLDDHPAAPASPLRLLRTLHIPLTGPTTTDQQLGRLLHDTAQTLHRLGTAHPIMRAVHGPHDGRTQAVTHRRLLAWAVHYVDVDVSTGAPHLTRRVDAVDIDGRVYQVSLLLTETCPVVHIDDRPDPHNTPATASGLASLALAARRLVGTGAQA